MKNIEIEIPDGFILDEEKYKNNIIAFLPKPIDPLAHLPKSWKELKTIEGYYIDCLDSLIEPIGKVSTSEESKCVIPTESQAKAILALCQLLQLRDRYNDGEQLVMDGSKSIPIIEIHNNKIRPWNYFSCNTVLRFKTKELRDHFLTHHIVLIEKAKELL